MSASAPTTPQVLAPVPRFTNATRPPAPAVQASSGFFNVDSRQTGKQAPVLTATDDLCLFAPVYLSAPGELQRFAEYFNANAYGDVTQIPGGAVFKSQVQLGDLSVRSKKLSKHTTPTVAGAVLVKLVRKFLPRVFTATMSSDLIETRLGLRTEAMQASQAALMQRVMAYAHVIQLCIENCPDAPDAAPHEFPLILMTQQEFQDIDYDASNPSLEYCNSPSATQKRFTPEQEIEQVMGDVEHETQPSTRKEQADDLQQQVAELTRSMNIMREKLETSNQGPAKRRLDYTVQNEIDEEDPRPVKRTRFEYLQDEPQGTPSDLFGGSDVLVTGVGSRTLSQQRQARTSQLDVGKFKLQHFSREVMDKIKSKKTILLSWVFKQISMSLTDSKTTLSLEDGVLTKIRSSDHTAKIKSMADIRKAFASIVTCVKILHPVLGADFVDQFHETMDEAYALSGNDIILTTNYLDEHINLALVMNDIGEGADLSLSLTLFTKCKVYRQNALRELREKIDEKKNPSGHGNGKKPRKGYDKDPQTPKNPKQWVGDNTQNRCRNWHFGVDCAFKNAEGKCPFIHEGDKGAGKK